MVVTGERFALTAKLGFLLKPFAARIEAEVAAYAASIAHERTVSDLPEVAL